MYEISAHDKISLTWKFLYKTADYKVARTIADANLECIRDFDVVRIFHEDKGVVFFEMKIEGGK